MSMKTIIGVGAAMTDDQLAFIREMGVEYVELNVKEEQTTPEALKAIADNFARFGLKIAIVSCNSLQKNDVIDLNLKEKNGQPADRDVEIAKFNQFVRNVHTIGVDTVSVAWQPTGIKRSGRQPGQHTRGGVSAYADMAQIEALPDDYDRTYSEEEVWENFEYFLKAITPTCVECGVRIALHPNDPPVPSLCGVGSLIWNMDGYRKAFAMDPAGVVGCKLCVGCWLEGGDKFGDLLSDIKEMQEQNRIVCVHFRNVSSTIPYFEETLSEDGYANMYEIMKQFIVCGYEGPISIDHAFKGYDSVGGMVAAFAYPTGHMKGLMHAIEIQLGKRDH